MVLLQRFRYYLIFSHYRRLIMVFGLSLSNLLGRDVFRHLIALLYLCGSDSNKQNEVDKLKISNYD